MNHHSSHAAGMVALLATIAVATVAVVPLFIPEAQSYAVEVLRIVPAVVSALRG